MLIGEDIANEDRPKVYLETSFMFYLTGRETTDQKIASEQAYTRKWWEVERPRCRVFTSSFVIQESKMQDNEIITGIRETRHEFAAKYGNDLRKIAAAADRIARDLGFKLMSDVEMAQSQVSIAGGAA